MNYKGKKVWHQSEKISVERKGENGKHRKNHKGKQERNLWEIVKAFAGEQMCDNFTEKNGRPNVFLKGKRKREVVERERKKK